MATREAQKRQTREALMQSALDLMDEGRGFGELSLRRVAQGADLVPTAFYRHFADMDELGLSLVDETFVVLRRLMRDVRRHADSVGSVIGGSVDAYIEHVQNNRTVFAFAARERYGGSPILRNAIARELQYFVEEISGEFAQEPSLKNLSGRQRDIMAHAIVTILAGLTGDIVDLRDEDSPDLETLRRRATDQILLVALGAVGWRREP